jgi:simple sugar transport system permease protein
VFHFTGNIPAAIMASIISAMLLSILHALAVFKLKANLFITGLAVNLLSSGLCIVLSDKLFDTRGVVSAQNIPGILKWYVIAGLLLLVISYAAIYKTPFGYELRACNKHGEALISLGKNPERYQTAALLISAFFCAIGGSFISLNLGIFVQGMSAGRGWIALVIIFLGGRNPLGILAAAFVFGIAESFSNHAQGFLNISADFLLAFPYVIALAAMIAVSVVPKEK